MSFPEPQVPERAGEVDAVLEDVQAADAQEDRPQSLSGRLRFDHLDYQRRARRAGGRRDLGQRGQGQVVHGHQGAAVEGGRRAHQSDRGRPSSFQCRVFSTNGFQVKSLFLL